MAGRTERTGITLVQLFEMFPDEECGPHMVRGSYLAGRQGLWSDAVVYGRERRPMPRCPTGARTAEATSA